MSCNETSDILSMFSAKGIRVKACVSYVINIFDKVISYLLLLELQITVKSTSIRTQIQNHNDDEEKLVSVMMLVLLLVFWQNNHIC